MVRNCGHAVAVLVGGLCILSGACSASSSSAERSESSPKTPPQQKVAASDADASTVNIDAIFPPGRGRELVLNNCTSCHTFVPIVVLQMDKEQWTRNGKEHRDRVIGMTDEDFDTLYAYLMANFNPDKPVPKLPKELLDTWTSY